MIESIKKAVNNPRLFILHLCRHWPFYKVSDEYYLKLLYKTYFGKELNLVNPKTFNEKIQWLKLYDRRPQYVELTDKYLVRDYVGERIGEQYLIPLLGVWDRPEDIDFDSLPNQFVLKCNHDSGSTIICRNKNNFDFQRAIKKLNKCLKCDYYLLSREYNYKYIKRKVIAEQYMVDNSENELKDYKFFCFNGKPKIMFIASDRGKENEEVKFDFFDMDFNRIQVSNDVPNSEREISKPECFEEMIQLSRKLSMGIPHVRVDFYEVNGHVYFGELTFHHGGGALKFQPKEFDELLGSYLDLPSATL